MGCPLMKYLYKQQSYWAKKLAEKPVAIAFGNVIPIIFFFQKRLGIKLVGITPKFLCGGVRNDDPGEPRP
jgi:hypothetical protein